jgi:hypothetical protein
MALNKKFHICILCEAPFGNQEDLDKHSELHSGGTIGNLNCQRCKKECDSHKELIIHLWRHLGILCCGKCDERFSSVADLKTHKKAKHPSGEKVKFTCDICDNTEKKNNPETPQNLGCTAPILNQKGV